MTPDPSAILPAVSPLAKQLRAAIEASGLSAAEVARRAGILPASLHRALSVDTGEDGEFSHVSEETLRRVCAVLGLDVVLVPEEAAQSVRELVAALRRPG